MTGRSYHYDSGWDQEHMRADVYAYCMTNCSREENYNMYSVCRMSAI